MVIVDVAGDVGDMDDVGEVINADKAGGVGISAVVMDVAV
jgi:hypothetical protein